MEAEQKAQVDPDESWSEPERWAWAEIRAGKIADFHARLSELDPNEPEGWDQTRKLSQAFLETILVREPFKGAVPRQGVHIVGAWFEEPIDLVNAQIVPQLWLDHCRFESPVDFSGATFSSDLSFDGSTITGKLKMNGLQVDGDLVMRDGARFAEVVLVGARVGDQLVMGGSTFTGKLNMNGLKVDGSLFMDDGARFAEVDLGSAKVGGHLAMHGSTFTGTLDMNGLKLDGSLFMSDGARFAKVVLVGARVEGQLAMVGSTFTGTLDMGSLQVDGILLMTDGARFAEVRLVSARVGDQLSMGGSTFTGKLDMESLEVGSTLFMRDATFERTIDMVFASIGSNLDLRGASLGSPEPGGSTVLDLTGTNVKSELMLGMSAARQTLWKPNSRLTLRNTRIGAMRDHEDAWPDRLELDGFTYERLGGLGSKDPENDMGRRPVEWLSKKWLERDPTHSPQPFRQLADVLRAAGHTTKANAILYEGRVRERKVSFQKRASGKWFERPAIAKWLGLGLLNWTIGHGLGARYFRVLYWVAGLTAIGTLVLATSGATADKTTFWMAACSFDQLLPLIELKKVYGEFVQNEITGFGEVYFYLHKIMGYVLGSFLVAGLGGLTQR